MSKKITWILVSCLMVIALVLSSCGPAAVEKEEGKTVTGEVIGKEAAEVEEEEEAAAVVEGKDMVTVTLTKLDGTKVQMTKERPRYGGTIRLAMSSSPRYFDNIYGIGTYIAPNQLTCDLLDAGQWGRGPSGTGELQCDFQILPPKELTGGALSESWEMPDLDTLVFHIREGVYWQDKPPVNGRELTAYDIAWCMERQWKAESSYQYTATPWDEAIVHMKATDKYTFEMKCQPGWAPDVYYLATCVVHIIPREVVEEYGDFNQWEHHVGSGPFILTDFIADSSSTLVRNPNYWQYDPLFPENRLPYVDTVKYLYITDKSTRVAAMRTAKLDWIAGLGWEDVESLLETDPLLEVYEFSPGGGPAVDFRMDDPEAPWADKRVRQALSMAFDNQTYADEFLGGHCQIHYWPVYPVVLFEGVYIPIEEMPEATRKLFEYRPDEARALLAKAGYPDGFKAELVCTSAWADLYTIIQEDWAKVGVELNFRVIESANLNSIGRAGDFTDMIQNRVDPAGEWEGYVRLAQGLPLNFGRIDDPLINQAREESKAAGLNIEGRKAAMKPVYLHILDSAYRVVLPERNQIHTWYPWLKGYSGEKYHGYLFTMFHFPIYSWVDQDLKFEMTGER